MNKPQITPSVKINIENIWAVIEEVLDRLKTLENAPLVGQSDKTNVADLQARMDTVEQVLWGEDK